MQKKKLVDLYPYRLTDDDPEFLLFRRAKGKIYQGQWRMIGGKVNSGETYWQAALRELKEETGLIPETFWTIPDLNTFYEHKTDLILQIPAFAAEIKNDATPSLDDEHSEFKWVKASEIELFIQWPEQKRLIRLTNTILTSDKILDDWLVTLP